MFGYLDKLDKFVHITLLWLGCLQLHADHGNLVAGINAYCNLNKYFCNLDKYVWIFGQIHFTLEVLIIPLWLGCLQLNADHGNLVVWMVAAW